jgi:cytidylate kinase
MDVAEKVVAIDGPAASGKSTIGRMLADELGYLLIDTGCMYRAATWAAIQEKADIDDEKAVVELTKHLEMSIVSPMGYDDGRFYTVFLNNLDVTWNLRQAEVDAKVSQVSAYPGVRINLVKRQREMASRGEVVVVGRDIGTVVLPAAPLKLYVVASAEERAKRRWHENLSRGEESNYHDILADIIRRDDFDANREHSPMRQAPDAIRIDTSGRSVEQILKQIMELEYISHLAASSKIA